MEAQYTVQLDQKGCLMIPAELRREMHLEPKSFVIISKEGDALKVVPGEVVQRRKVREIPLEEFAQGLIDGAVTPEGIADAREAIRSLGLDPDDFKPQF